MEKKGKNHYVVVSIFLILVISVFAIPLSSANVFDWAKAKITGRATTQQVTLNITVGNADPNITKVDSISAVTLTENTNKNLVINFTAYDADGSGNLKSAGATLNITKSGEAVRANYSCNQVNTFASNYANYSCLVTLWYFDDSGTWNIGASVNDTSDGQGFNTTTSFTVNLLTAFVSSPSALTFASLNPGSVNTTSNNDPLTLNNTGNDPIAAGSIDINATNLVGETDSLKALYANNFSVAPFGNSGTIECNSTSTSMSKSVYTAVTGAYLNKGNHTINNGTNGQEQLYLCLRTAGTELSSQSYSTTSQGSWTVRVS